MPIRQDSAEDSVMLHVFRSLLLYSTLENDQVYFSKSLHVPSMPHVAARQWNVVVLGKTWQVLMIVRTQRNGKGFCTLINFMHLFLYCPPRFLCTCSNVYTCIAGLEQQRAGTRERERELLTATNHCTRKKRCVCPNSHAQTLILVLSPSLCVV